MYVQMELLVLIIITVFCFDIVYSVTCYKTDPRGFTQAFSCPAPTDRPNEYFCCGATKGQFCCSSDIYHSKKQEPNGKTPPGEIDNEPQTSTVVCVTMTIVTSLVLILILLLCCCMAKCPLYQKRHRSRIGSGPIGSITVVTNQTQHMPQPVLQPHPPPAYSLFGGQPRLASHNGHNSVYPPPAYSLFEERDICINSSQSPPPPYVDITRSR